MFFSHDFFIYFFSFNDYFFSFCFSSARLDARTKFDDQRRAVTSGLEKKKKKKSSLILKVEKSGDSGRAEETDSD